MLTFNIERDFKVTEVKIEVKFPQIAKILISAIKKTLFSDKIYRPNPMILPGTPI